MKTLIISWHGLGDNIILTPVLRKYVQDTGEEIHLAHLRRLPVNDLLSECPYIQGFHQISDVWNDFNSVDIGRKMVIREAEGIAQQFNFDKIIELTLSPRLGKAHKIFRAALELGIEVDDYRTEIFPKITEEVKEQATEWLKKVNTPRLFIQLETGNPPKNVSPGLLNSLLMKVDAFSLIEYGSNTILGHTLPLGNIPLEMEILSRCDRVVCADSFIMHAAGALGIPTTAIFISTAPQWVIPLHNTPIDILIKV